MKNRLKVFQCKALKNLRSNMEQQYRKQAMEIVHWLAIQLADTPLFHHSSIVKRDCGKGRFCLKSRKRTWEVKEEDSTLDESLLTEDSIVLAHMSVYDQKEAQNAIPYRIVTGFDVNSAGYHRSVHYGVTGKTEGKIFLNHNLKQLFEHRKKFAWKGKDSLYDVWLISEGECRQQFDLELFTERYPDWRQQQKPFRLETIFLNAEPFVIRNLIDEVVELSG